MNGNKAIRLPLHRRKPRLICGWDLWNVEGSNEPINDGETKNEPINDGENKVLSDKENTVLSLINDNPSITTVTLIEKTGFSRPTIERAIKKLKIQKYIVRIGGDKGGHWEIIKR